MSFTKDTSKIQDVGTSLAVQWLRCFTSTARGMDSIPGQGTKISHAVWHSQKIENKIK